MACRFIGLFDVPRDIRRSFMAQDQRNNRTRGDRTLSHWTDRSIAPRRAALNALTQVVAHKRMLTHLKPDPGLEPAEAARASRLVQTVLRHMGPLDQIIAPFVDRPPVPRAHDPAARGGRASDRPGGAHGVVNSAVALAKSGGAKTARASGLVNAVLRRIAEGGQALGPNMPAALAELDRGTGPQIRGRADPARHRGRARGRTAPLD
jgi:16S rRNA (cytosine967-C5)-methyltransferase